MPLVSASGNPGKSKIEHCAKSKSRRTHILARTKPIRKWTRGVAVIVGLAILCLTAPRGYGQQNETGKKTAELRGTGQISPPQFNGQWAFIGPEPTAPPPGGLAGTSGNTAGRVTAIAIDPTDPSGKTVFIGVAQGGVWTTTNGGAAWTPLTDNQQSLAIGALAITIDPSNSLDARHRVIYAGTGEMAATAAYDAYPGSGVLKSLDGGLTWTQTCQGPAFTNPTCPFEGPFTDGFFPGGGARVGSLAVNSNNSQLILAGVQIYSSSSITGQAGRPGIYCTNDAGATWAQIIPSGLTGTALATSLFYVSPTTAYAALGDYLGDPTNGIYVSQNADQVCSKQIWSRVAGSGLPSQTRMGWIDLAPAPNAVNRQTILYSGIADTNSSSDNLLGVFRSADGGNTWVQLSNVPDFCATKCWYDMVMGVDPADSTGNTVFFGGGASSTPAGTTLLRTTDGGQSVGDFSGVGDGTIIHIGQHAIAFTPSGSEVYIANDGGVWSSTNAANPATASGSQTWNDLNNTMAISQFNPGISMHPSDPGLAFGGTQGNGTQEYQIGGSGSSWTDTRTCTDGGYTVVDPNEQTTAYLSCAGFSGQAQIFKSTLAGQSGTFALLSSSNSIGNQPNNSKDPLAPIPPLIIDAQRAEHLYYGTYLLFEATDGGATWNAVSGDLTSGGLANGFALTTIAMAPLSGGAYNLYTGANDGTVEMAANVIPGSSPTFLKISNGLPTRTISKIVADPSDTSGKTVYAAFAGFSVDQSIDGSPTDLKGHIFKTTNGGAAWTDIGCHTSNCAAPLVTDLPDLPVNDIALDPDDISGHSTIYAATDSGVYVSIDGGATWAKLGNNLPNVPVLSLALHEPSRTLRAATHGRGAWDYPLPALAGTSAFELSGLTPISAQTGATSLTLNLSGRGFTSNSVVQWNGLAIGVTNVQVNIATQTISAQISTGLTATPGAALITVFDSTQSPTVTNALAFTLVGSLPTLTSVQPQQVNAGAGDTLITVTGTGFSPTGFITFNNATTGVSSSSVNSAGTQITATLSHTLLQFGGQFKIGVTNPPPGGGAAPVELAFVVNNSPAPANDNFANATTVASASFSDTVDNSSATTEATDPTPGCAGQSGNSRGKSVWWKYTASAAGTTSVDTIGSAYDTVLDVVTGLPGSFSEVACGHNTTSVGQTQTGFNAVAGTTYFFMVTVYDSTLCNPSSPSGLECGGKTVFNFAGPLPGGVTAQPVSMSVTAGGSASFTIKTLAPPLSGQVTLTIAGCPPVSTCKFTSASITAGTSTTLNVSTSASTTSVSAPVNRQVPNTDTPSSLPNSHTWELLSLIFAGLLTLRQRRLRTRSSRLMPFLAIAALLAFAGCTTGCSALTGAPPPVTIPGTTPGTYPLVITATGNGGTTASTTVTLTVN